MTKTRDLADLATGITSGNITDGAIVNADINASAGVVSSKLTFTQSGTGATQRTVESKLQDVASVKDFGAVGDGTTDDTTAFQNALSSAKAVIVPRGVYRITDECTVGRGGSLLGVNVNQVGTCSKILLDSADASIRCGAESYVDKLLIDGNNVADKGIFIVSNNHNCHLSNLIIKNCTIGLLLESTTFSNRFTNIISLVNGTNFKIDSLGQSAASVNFYGCEANDCTTGYNLHSIGGGITWHGGSIQNPDSGALGNIKNEEGQLLIFGSYIEGQAAGFSCETVGNTNVGTYTLVQSLSNAQFGDDGFKATGPYAKVKISDCSLRGSGSTNNTLFSAVQGGKIITESIDIVNYTAADPSKFETLSSGAGASSYPIESTDGTLIASLDASFLNTNATKVQCSTAVQSTTTYTKPNALQVTCSGNTPRLELPLKTLPNDVLNGLAGRLILVKVIARFDHSSTNNSFFQMTTNTADITVNSDSTNASDTNIAAGSWAYYSMLMIPNTDTPANLNIRMLFSSNASGSCTDTVYVDRFDVYALTAAL